MVDTEQRWRSHRLVYLVMAMGWGPTPGNPQEVARVFRMQMQRKLASAIPAERMYAADVIGAQGQYAQQREGEFRRQLDRFVGAKPDEPFQIVEGMPDNLCHLLKQCGHGDHCPKRSHELFGGARDVLKAEGDELSFFLKNATNIGRGGGIRLETRRTKFDDESEAMVRVAHTTVGTVKEVLRVTQMYYDDASRNRRR